MASFLGFPGDHGEVQQKKLLQEQQSRAISEDFALTQQSHIIRNMLSSCVLLAWQHARADLTKQVLASLGPRTLNPKPCKKLEVLSCASVESLLKTSRKP